MRALKILFYSIITLVVVAFAVGRLLDEHTIRGEGPVRERTVNADGFSAISVSGGWEVIITPGEAYGFSFEAQQNLLDLMKVSVDGDELNIEMDGNVKTDDPMVVRISAPVITDIDLSGATKLNSEASFSGESLSIHGSGACEITIGCDLDALFLDLSGASKTTLSGRVDDLTISLSGASKIYAGDCASKIVKLNASGAAYADLNVSEELHVDASGASKINYKGNPSIHSTVSGPGILRKK